MSIPQALPLASSVRQALPRASGAVTREFLQTFVGQSVEDFCENGTDGNATGVGKFGRKGDTANHCAHFVSHALGFRVGKLCSVMSSKGSRNPASGRSLVVSDLFNACPSRGPWSEKPKDLTCCMIFAVIANGASEEGGKWVMSNVQNKHVGIFLSGECYNYHNRTHEGVAVDGPEFFARVYGPNTKAFYGTFPLVA